VTLFTVHYASKAIDILFLQKRTQNRLAAAHSRRRLMLLGSPPDMVHSRLLRRTDLSQPDSTDRQCQQAPSAHISPLLQRISGYKEPLPPRLVRQKGSLYISDRAQRSHTIGLYYISCRLAMAKMLIYSHFCDRYCSSASQIGAWISEMPPPIMPSTDRICCLSTPSTPPAATQAAS